MEKVQKSQLVKAAFFLLLLLLIPFVSTSMRPSYLYLLLNILILSLGIESGFLAAISGHNEDKKPPIASAASAASASPRANVEPLSMTGSGCGEFNGELAAKMSAVTDRIVAGAARAVNKVKRCPSVPSLFFIGSHEIEGDKDVGLELVEQEEEKVILKGVIREEPSGQELFAKAETFISNFYKQLKMQREESWRRIHGLLS